jgi:hypothetical protein
MSRAILQKRRLGTRQIHVIVMITESAALFSKRVMQLVLGF